MKKLKSKSTLTFLIHPRDTTDLWRRVGMMMRVGEERGMQWFNKPWLNKVADFVMLYLPMIYPRAGFTNCTPKGFDVNGEATGYIVAVLLTGEQMKSLAEQKRSALVRERIARAILYAQDKLGAKVVGLGAYTAPFMGDGLLAVRDERIKCAVTHGDSLSAASGCAAVIKTLSIKKVNIRESTIAIVGASGVVGRAMTLLLQQLKPKRMILVAHTRMAKLKQLEKDLRNRGFDGKINLSLDTKDIEGSEVVVLTTTANGDIVSANMLQKTSVVVDMAQPPNMSQVVCDAAPHVLRVDGGYMDVSGVTSIPFNMGPPRGVTFACLTETMTLALSNDQENHVGTVDPDFAMSILMKAKKLGFRLAPLTSFSKPIIESG